MDRVLARLCQGITACCWGNFKTDFDIVIHIFLMQCPSRRNMFVNLLRVGVGRFGHFFVISNAYKCSQLFMMIHWENPIKKTIATFIKNWHKMIAKWPA